LYLHILDWWDNEVIIYNPLDQNITWHGDGYESSLWSKDVRYMTFIPANLVAGWDLAYKETKIAQRQLNFLSPYTIADEWYDQLEYTAPTQLLYPNSEVSLTL
jgi:hypothetical protein